MFRVDVHGVPRAVANLKRTANTTVDRVARGMYLEAERVMAESKEFYVPVRTGTLRSTGHVSPPRMVAGRIVVELIYGGPAAPYAIVVHERPKIHAWSPTAAGTEGVNKFLEAPFRKNAPDLPERIGRWVEHFAQNRAS